ncbi:hypothetical protein ACHAQA_001521 [Verticillium albo-atrum]
MIHYGKAMALGKDLKSPAKLITLSIALMGSASPLYRFPDISKHLIAGLKMLRETGYESLQAEMPQLAGVMARMDVHAMTLSDSQSPYPFDESISRGGVDDGMLRESEDITSHGQATSTLFVLLRRFMLLEERFMGGLCTPISFYTEHALILENMQHWERKMTVFEQSWQKRPSSASNQEGDTTIGRLSIRFWHLFLSLGLKNYFLNNEAHWDEYLPDMERMAGLGIAMTRLYRVDIPFCEEECSYRCKS